ncbi:MAG: hypothetical protein WCF36_03805 [Candidatus Nanopelagicales bacterium]
MKTKVVFVAGFVGGYVLGSRAGRTRYEELKRRSQDLMESPFVAEKAAQVKDFAAEKAPVVKHKVGDAAAKATESVKDTVSRDSGGSSGAVGDQPVPPAADSEVAGAPALVLTESQVSKEGAP